MQKKHMALAALALCTALLAGCGVPAGDTDAPELLEPAGVTLDYAEVVRMDICTLNSYTAAVIPYVEELFFTVDGTVETVNAYIGASFREGDVLLTLDETDRIEERDSLLREQEYLQAVYSNNADTRRIDLEIARLRLQKAAVNGASETELITLQGNIDMLELEARQQQDSEQADLERIRTRLETLDAEISQNALYAPFDGTVVDMVTLREGYGVGSYDVLIRLADDSRLSLSGEHINSASVQRAGDICAMIHGKRYEIEAEPMDMTEYFQVALSGGQLDTHFRFVTPPDGLAAGDFAYIQVVTAMTPDALAIPYGALFTDSIGKYVYKLEDGQRVRVNVRTGTNNGLYIQITEGLEEGDRVYVKE